MPGIHGFFDIGDRFYKENKSELDYYCENPEFHVYCMKYDLYSEGIMFAIEAFKRYKPPKEKVDRIANYCFITLQNFKCRKTDVDKMLLFLKKIDYLYESGEWIIETGKSENLHIHLLVKIIDAKKHKNKLNIEWAKLFDNNITDKDFYKLSQWRASKLMPSYEQWCLEKLEYFSNDTKGTHANKEDLGLRGSFAGGGVILG